MTRRGAVLTFLVVLSVLNYLDRVCISVAGVRMQADLGIPEDRWGWVLGVFYLSYGLFEIPTGAWGDRFGQRRVITRIVVWWSVFTCLTGLVSSFPMLVAVQLLFGAGEAGAYPNMAGALGRWFRPTERARTQGAVWAASRVGGAVAPLAVVPLMAALGWRAAFVIFGGLGAAWAAAWFAWYRDPPAGGGDAGHAGVPWGRLFRSRQVWLILAMAWCYGWGSSFYLSRLHTYLVKGRGLTEAEMGYYAALPFVCGAVGNLAGGVLADRLSRRLGLRAGRRLVGSVALAASAALLLTAAVTTGKAVGVAALALGYGAMDCMLPSNWANCQDIGGRFAGAVSGAMNTAVQAGAFTGSVLFGYLVGWFGYNAPLVPIAAMMLVSAGLFARIDPTRPLVPERPAPVAEDAACA